MPPRLPGPELRSPAPGTRVHRGECGAARTKGVLATTGGGITHPTHQQCWVHHRSSFFSPNLYSVRNTNTRKQSR